MLRAVFSISAILISASSTKIWDPRKLKLSQYLSRVICFFIQIRCVSIAIVCIKMEDYNFATNNEATMERTSFFPIIRKVELPKYDLNYFYVLQTF